MLCPNAYCGTEIAIAAPRCPLCGMNLAPPLPLVDADADIDYGVAPEVAPLVATASAAEPLPSQLVVEHLPFEFSGDALEYFRIWVVNLAFTIATVGVYSAWAKVRTTRYFYGHTRVGGGGFEYLANPVAILKGRMLAVILFALYWFTGDVAVVSTVLSLVFSVVFPWMLVRGLAFRAHNSAYRSIRFRFTGEYREAANAYLFRPMLALLSLGILYPVVRCYQQRFIVGHSQLGTSLFHLDAVPHDFFEMYVKFGLLISLGVVVGLVAFALGTFAFGGLALLIGWFAWCDLAASFQNLVYNRTSSGPYRLVSTLDARSLFWLQLLNTAGVLCSLGLLVPWARIRTARYRTSRLALATTAGLEGIVAERADDVSAVGSETGEVFDVDLGF